MKKSLLIAAAAVVLCSCNNADKYTIEGSFEGLTGMVYLFDEQENIVDSTAVKNGAFEFKGKVEAPAMRYIASSRGDQPATFTAQLILEPGVIVVAADAKSNSGTSVSGTPANDANKAYSEAGRALVGEFRDASTTDERRAAIEKEYETLSRTAFEANSSNYFGAMLLAQQLGYEMNGQEILDQIAKFPAPIQQSILVTKLKENAEQKIRTDVGQPYIEIAQKNAAGEEVTLKSVIENPANKYTLVDFWASWCTPCMGEVPVLKKTYDAFHAKGFEIYGVSFDKDREKWLAAVDQNGMGWIHVSDVTGFDNQAAKDYAVRGIPSNFLIDAQGFIVAKNLRGEALYEKVAELLAEPQPQQ